MNLQAEILTASPELSPYIEYYKFIRGSIHGTYKIVPSFNQEIYFCLGPGEYWIKSPGLYEVNNPLIFMTGIHEVDQDIFACVPDYSDIRTFVIVFKPNGIQKLFRLANSEIQKYAIDGIDIFKGGAGQILEQLQHASDAYTMRTRLESYLSGLIIECYEDQTFKVMTQYIRQNLGAMSVNNLAEKFYITPRTLQRRFRDEYGITPKNYLQLVRINAAVSKLASGSYESLSELAYFSGYYDQSHFIRDIKKICGVLPTIIEKEQALFQCDNISFASAI